MGNPKIHRLPAESKGSGPWNSRLVPYENDIARWRSERKTYREITELLAVEKDVQVSFSMVQKFVKARSKRRPYEIILSPEAGAEQVRHSAFSSSEGPANLLDDVENSSPDGGADALKSGQKAKLTTTPIGSKFTENEANSFGPPDSLDVENDENGGILQSKIGNQNERGTVADSMKVTSKLHAKPAASVHSSKPKSDDSGWDSLSGEAAREDAESAKSASARRGNLLSQVFKKEGEEQ